ncbi:MAG TPA: DUF1653 domain-containing protein [Gemmataceae bacterium]|jgi:cupin 2 domain-containing protein|nr:DUF1653 domain-containing protein [Gemmataceae bacterium]
MTEMNALTPGRYRHYRGKEYSVLGVARHSETLEEFVVYRQEYGDHGLWVRPRQMFLETVNVDGREVPRFQHLEAERDNVLVNQGSLLAGIPASLPEELVELILREQNVRIERIISRGHVSPQDFWYDQDRHEWILLLRGAARLSIEGEEQAIEMIPGDFIFMPAHKRHRVTWTAPDEPTIWLAVFFVK